MSLLLLFNVGLGATATGDVGQVLLGTPVATASVGNSVSVTLSTVTVSRPLATAAASANAVGNIGTVTTTPPLGGVVMGASVSVPLGTVSVNPALASAKGGTTIGATLATTSLSSPQAGATVSITATVALTTVTLSPASAYARGGATVSLLSPVVYSLTPEVIAVGTRAPRPHESRIVMPPKHTRVVSMLKIDRRIKLRNFR